MSGLLASGDVLFDRFDDSGSSTGYVDLGNTTKFAIQEASEKKERISKVRNTYGQVLSSVAIKQPATISISMDEMEKEALAMALLGEVQPLNVQAGNVTDADVKMILGKYVSLGQDNVTTVVVKNKAGSTTYKENIDYAVNRGLGFVRAIPGGAIKDGDVVKATFSYSALSGSTIKGSVKPTIRGALILDGLNLDTGEVIIVRVLEAVLTPSSEVDFKSDDFVGMELQGSLITPKGLASPYQVDIRN